MTERPPASQFASIPEIRSDVAHAARVWNYWLGGKDNYEADRVAGDAVTATYPQIVDMAVKSRGFLVRAVRHLAAEAGVRQFLDIGTGLPTMQNTHEVAQGVAPESKVVYVDNDPLVLAHARALLVNTSPEGVTTYVNADYHQPDQIIADARNVLNFNEPLAAMFMGVLGFAPDFDEVLSIVRRVMDAAPSGSYLVLWDATDTSEGMRVGTDGYNANAPIAYNLRSPERLAQCFEGLEMVDPGLVPLTQWRPDEVEVGTIEPVDAYCAVARKP
ncbi:SAM-dependent methyltransferase [Actinomadura rugatobispora]|uniref:SAM-dependent methyltransferase n=1 Tax=Actinomadura rugatobispora TaxID=1994 RepID=A0ABW0ZMX9_9ACTN|nr:SAM-dependent methyltransferase [Actinomadura rugatobispora]